MKVAASQEPCDEAEATELLLALAQAAAQGNAVAIRLKSQYAAKEISEAELLERARRLVHD
eukprot:CAMPEP_0119390754 /NCGR_PEP_ID=MMETSP1334-20130426/114582_1 /TAXON_ID=127549 /ORGANISM="Calcidiscus leptoporus, Strain RCC1130" /LENGTH=60 /DNA_ID=CAMNT_0007413319 /DNA_START=56 /DNA_END=235 /DNA_ORIENTATION=-